MDKHFDILIATPGNAMHNGYVKSLVETMTHLSSIGVSYKWLNGTSSLVHHAREVLMSGDGTMDADDLGPLHDRVTYKKIIWIDSDIEWNVSDFMKLYESDYDIITGAYLLANGKTSTIHTQRHPSGIPKDEMKNIKNVMKIDACGFGFIAMKSGVFEKIERPWFSHLVQPIVNSRGKTLYTSLGEDVSWCIKAKNAGMNIHFEPSVLVTHLKTNKINWD